MLCVPVLSFRWKGGWILVLKLYIYIYTHTHTHTTNVSPLEWMSAIICLHQYAQVAGEDVFILWLSAGA